MSDGKVLAASHDGAYVIRFEGDVRLTLCTTIDDYFETMYQDPAFYSVWVDLCDAEGLDSTTLGLLAKLALTVKERFGFQPAIYSCNAGINRLVKSMGFQRLFELHEEVCDNPDDVAAVPMVPGSEEETRRKVIEAHRILMGLNATNRARFRDLLAALEGG
ncbi:MAG: STAS domain-containing protein [Halieaceae bacterium]|jgi:anti-anti-sigma factor|nr:STAS domain-containing protein [Halieaceae bacterium]MCB1848344.1 STAS domain-containing protein [Halieaceae bacterium]MCP5148253.1 STAS domain-containing protein [Pseudomonadales bacterium]MCP5188244.1 STAS domain-containing protein [Pseudomonadales bacterium]